ncbi:MAG TPA: hypothetical protein VMW51_03885, partial [Terriglobia bacterium]|nr:hypothetical protein [Terriglobia bacterium]
MGRFLFFMVLGCLFIASQIFWISQVGKLGAKLIPARNPRRWVAVAGAAVYIFLLAYNFLSARDVAATSLSLRIALLEAPIRWWIFSSIG